MPQKPAMRMERRISEQIQIEKHALEMYEQDTGARRLFIKRDSGLETIENRLIRNCGIVETTWYKNFKRTFAHKPVPRETTKLEELFSWLERPAQFMKCLSWDGKYHLYKPYFGMLKLDPTHNLFYVDNYLFWRLYGPIPVKFRMKAGPMCGVGKPYGHMGEDAWCVNPYHVTFDMTSTRQLSDEEKKTLEKWHLDRSERIRKYGKQIDKAKAASL